MKLSIVLLIVFTTAVVQAKKITLTSNEGSITVNIRNIDNHGRIKTGELMKIIKERLEKLEYDYISRLGRYERSGALKELKVIKILLSKFPRGNFIILKGREISERKGKDVSKKRYAMRSMDFQMLMSRIKSKSFTSGKLSYIKSAAKFNYFNMNQLKKLIKIFKKIDSGERISVIKAVFPKLINKRNSYTLMDFFSFSSDKEKIKQIINRYK